MAISATKRSPANSPATQKRETVAEVQPIPPVTREVLPQTVDLIADAVGEMLATGTADRSLNRLLQAAIEHITRRTYERGIGCDSDEQIVTDAIEGENKRNFQNWKQDIIALWRHNRRKSSAAIEPSTLTERIRLGARARLEDLLEAFLGQATPEEIRFLHAVMENYGCIGRVNPAFPYQSMALGEAFQWELGQDAAYVVVPERLRDQVEKYIQALRAVEDKAA